MSIAWQIETLKAVRLTLDPNEPSVSDRQDRLVDFSTDALASARILMIGGGGLGGEVATGLARKGVGTIIIADADTIEPHNLARQFFLEEDLYKLKGPALAKNIVNHSFLGTTCIGHAAYFTPESAPVLLDRVDIGICGVDNDACRYHAARLFRQASIPLICLAVDEAAMSGWVLVQEADDPCVGCMFPRMSRLSNQKQRCRPVPSTLNILRLLAGVALHAVDTLLMPRVRYWNYFTINLAGGAPVFAQEKPRPGCALCAQHKQGRNHAANTSS